MQKITKTIRLSLIYITALLLVSSYPLSTMAQAVETTTPTTTTTSDTTQTATPTSTTPATSSQTSTDTEAVSTTPTTSTTTSTATTTEPEKPKETYTYNEETGHWDSNYWQYNPETGKYERPPEYTQAGSLTAPSPVIVEPLTAETTDKTATKQMSDATLDVETKNAITNAITSGSLSGDATVKNNTEAGSATSGDALASTTIINNVNSTVTNDSNQKAATFVSDVMGDVHGDIILQPMLLKAMLEAGMQESTGGTTTVKTTNELINDINLGAESGSATVTGNTKAGDATTGDANTVANVLNIVNSMIAANRSFVGTINIYGSLDGDILIAPDFIPQMIANNGTSGTSEGSTVVSAKDTQSIVNNIALAAETGKAVVSGNTQAGDASTGDANTNLVLFNLSGHEIIASNSLLVFINVLGKWVGVIVDAPTGATAAALGRGVTTNSSMSPDLVIDATTDTMITNNINLASLSGDATVARNTRAGNATTGNATASANIGNIVGTQMGLSDWFGVLFINVFGSWNGSFGIDTLSGNRPTATGATGPTPSRTSDGEQPLRVIEFIPHSHMSPAYSPGPAVTIVGDDGSGTYAAMNTNTDPRSSQIRLVSATQNADIGTDDSGAFAILSPSNIRPELHLTWLSGITFLVGLSIVGASMLSDARKRKMLLK